MGEFANYFNDEQAQSLEELCEYESGQISDAEAIERGILDEDGSLPNDAPTTWGVHDVASLEVEMLKCETALNKVLNKKKPILVKTGVKESYWRSGDKLYKPSEMSTKHLENAIKFAKRNNDNHPIVKEMIAELEGRCGG
jgi:hypothetical protein